MAWEQIRRLTENQGSSENPPLFWAVHTNTPERGWQAPGNSPAQRRFRAAPSPRKARATVTRWDLPQPHHGTAVRLCQVPHGPSAQSRGRVSIWSWLCVWGAPGMHSYQVPCAGCSGTRGARAPGPHGTRHGRQWHRDCSLVPAVPQSPPLLPWPAGPLPQPTAPRSQACPSLLPAAELVVGGPAGSLAGSGPSSRRADGKQSMEFARLKVKYNTHTDFVRGPGTAAFVGSD